MLCFKNDANGQALILIAILMSGALMMMGLVIDGGVALVLRRKVQNAADAAARAGTRDLALGLSDADILNRIEEYAVTHNGATSFQATYYPGGEEVGHGQVPDVATGVMVNPSIEFSTLFAGIVGLNEITVKAAAEARFGAVRSAPFLAPVAVHCDPSKIGDEDNVCPSDSFTFGSSYQLWGETTGPGSFGWLDWDGTPVSNPDLVGNLTAHQNSGVWHVGDDVPTGPGVQNSGPVRDVLDAWLTKPESERHWTIVVYDYVDDSGSNLAYHVYGFAEFVLTGYNFNGNPKFIHGKFMRWTEPIKDIEIDNKGAGVTGIWITQ